MWAALPYWNEVISPDATSLIYHFYTCLFRLLLPTCLPFSEDASTCLYCLLWRFTRVHLHVRSCLELAAKLLNVFYFPFTGSCLEGKELKKHFSFSFILTHPLKTLLWEVSGCPASRATEEEVWIYELTLLVVMHQEQCLTGTVWASFPQDSLHHACVKRSQESVLHFFRLL